MANKNAAQAPARVVLDYARQIYEVKPGQDVLLEVYGWATLYDIRRVKEKSINPRDLVTFVQVDKNEKDSPAHFISGNFFEFHVSQSGQAYFDNFVYLKMPKGHPETNLAKSLVQGRRKPGDLTKISGVSK